MTIWGSTGGRRRLVGATVGTAAVLAPAALASAASAASISVDKACYVVANKRPPAIVITGSGFVPGSTVAITSGRTAILDASAPVDGAGHIAVRTGILPARTTIVPQTTRLTARDGASTATTRATVTFRAAYHGATRREPGLRALTETTKWQFAGFARGRTIWGHYTIGGRQVALQAFGTARGKCGTLTTHNALFPGTPHHSSYPLQVDQQKKYSRTTQIKVVGRVSLRFF